MGFENKFARLMRNTGPARFFVPVGIILVVVGVILMVFSGGNFAETTGKVLSVTEIPRTDPDEAQQYDVQFEYTVDGKVYTGTFSLSGDYQTGDEITIYYNTENPESITNAKNGNLIGIIMIGAGVVGAVVGVFLTVKAFQKSKALDEAIPGGKPNPADFEGFKTAEGVTEYYFRFDGHSLKPGYLVEDAERKILFEGKMTKQAIVGARTFEFHNHVNGTVEEHAVGHTVTQSYNDEMFSRKSWFKLDGKNIWDILHDRGIRLSTNMLGKFPYFIYDVTKDGKPFARIETSSIYVHEDEEAQHKLVIPTGNMYYRFWTASSDFDTLFLTIFAISETEQTVVE